MNEVKNEVKNTEILRAIINSIGDARYSVKELSRMFIENVQMLRIEESEQVFTDITNNIENLQCLIDYIAEVQSGIRCLGGLTVPPDPISSQDQGIHVFKDMNSAFESRDWVMLSDLIEYELAPLLNREDEWFSLLDKKLVEYTV